MNYLNSIKIKNFYSIKEIELTNLSNKKEIYIVGENGDGKTLLLQAITIALKGVNEGDVFNLTKSQKIETFVTFDDNKEFNLTNGEYKNLFAYGSNRSNSCKMEIDKTGYLTLFNNSLDLKTPTNLLIELYNASLHTDLKVSLDDVISIMKALLNKEVEIDVTYNNVTFKEKGSNVSFEQLSAGYKSVIIIICDLIDRLLKSQPEVKNISEYQAIVLIDEVELHLHPKWKYNFIKTLRNIFPKIQFIITTHSPTVILGASKDAVFYKIYKKDGEINISDKIPNKGYTNNTLISSPLFDLDTMASRKFDDNEFSSDDYICQKLHKIIKTKIKQENLFNDEEIDKLVESELSKL